MYQTILVALDGSEFSASALPAAAALARRSRAQLHLVVVFDPSTMLNFTPGEVAIPVFDSSMADKRCADLRGWVDELAASISNTGVSASGTLLEGTVVEALAEHAVLTAAELVIMTTHGRGGLNRLRLGSVASSFLGRSPVPVFLVRPAGPDAPAAGRELPTGTLLVTLDGSPFAEAMLPHATRFASAAGLAVELLRVAEPAFTPLSLFGPNALVIENFVGTDEESGALAYLQQLVGRTQGEPAPRIKVLSDTSAARAIVNYAHETRPGALAIATHGRSGLVRLILGSVADKVLQGVEQPLLVYRPSDDESTAPSAGAGVGTAA